MDIYVPKTADEYVDIFLKRKRLFFIPFFMVAALVALAYPFLPRLYESRALVLVEEERILNPLVQGLAVKDSFDKRLKTLTAQIMNWSSMVELVQQVHLADNISDQKEFERLILSMRRRIDVSMLTDNIIQISYEDKDRRMAMDVTNAVAENLANKNKKEKQEDAATAIEFIRGQLNVYKDKLQNSERSFFLNKVSADLDESIKKRNLLREQVGQIEKTVVIQTIKEQSPIILDLRKELAQVESETNQLLLNAKKDSPMVKEHMERINNLKQRIKMEELSQPSSETSATNPVYQDAQRQVKELELNISTLEKRREDLQSGKVEAKPVSEQELMAMERDKKVNEDIYKSLLMRLENAHISQKLGEEGENGTFRILDPARMALKPSKPKPVFVLAAGIVAALLAGFGAVFMREYFDTSLRNVQDAKDYVPLPLMAYIPRIVTGLNGARPNLLTEPPEQALRKRWTPRWLKKLQKAKKVELTYFADKVRDPKVSPYIVSFHDPESMPAEQYRLFQTQFLYMGQKQPLKTVLVTSALEGEGKTSASVNIAVTLATELNRRILLMDCDLRRGKMAKTLGLNSKIGVFDYLSGTSPLKPLLQDAGLPNLTVLAAGSQSNSPTKLLVSEKMHQLMEALRAEFDFIIMDAPPILNLSDVPVLAAQADGIVLVVKAEATQRTLVKDALAALEQSHQANVLGYVLTHVQNHVSSYVYQYIAGGQ